MATENLIDSTFTANHACTRIAALQTAIEAGEANDVAPFPVKAGGDDKDRAAVKKATKKIADAFAAGSLPDAADVAVVYLGGRLGADPSAANDEVLLVQRFALAIDDYVNQEPLKIAA